MNKQEIMARYTKLVADRPYKLKKFKIYFKPYLFDEDNEESIFFGENNIQIDKTIIFNANAFSEDDFYIGAWNTLVHEVTHIEVLWHGDMFWKTFYNNLEKVDDLRKEFNI
jgi:hypothetical protein